jgi:hypothetical protein
MLLPFGKAQNTGSQSSQSCLREIIFLPRFRSEHINEFRIEVESISPLDGQEVANFVVGDAAGPMKEAPFRIEILHFLPENDARSLENIFDVGRIDQLLGNEGINSMPMFHQLCDKRIGC